MRTPPTMELAQAPSRATEPSNDKTLPELSREGPSFILLRYVLIAAAAYLFLFEGETSSPAVIAMIIATALLSNVLLSHVPEDALTRPLVVGAVICVDIAWIAFGLLYIGKLGSDIFFLYFFVLFLAAMGQNLMLIVGAGALIGLMDVALFVSPGQSSWTSVSLIRIPFIFTAALFYGYLTERWKREHRWALLAKEFSHKLAQIVQEQTQDLQRLYEQAKEQAMELEKANNVKDEFLRVMSHELRTPLSVIMGYMGIIKDRRHNITPDQEGHLLERVLAQCRDLLSMINTILQATSMRAQALQVETHQVSLEKFLAELRSFYAVPLKRDLILTWDYPANLPVIETDGGKLRQILQNLINNAIKFTHQGRVSVSARMKKAPPLAPGTFAPHQRVSGAQARGSGGAEGPGKQWVEFQVADTGIGIEPEVLPTIFDMFRQVDSSERRSYGGVGMGLYIVKKLTELLGGSIEVESQLGKGSIFTVTIPCDT